MSTKITVTLPDDAIIRLENMAKLTGQHVDDVLATTIALSLPDLEAATFDANAVAELSDDEVVRLTKIEMKTEQDRRLTELLDRQQAGMLSESERAELQTLMQTYQIGLLRKAQALHEAVKRGLMEPLGS